MKNPLTRLFPKLVPPKLRPASKSVVLHCSNANPYAAPGGLERYVIQSTRYAKSDLSLSPIICFPSQLSQASEYAYDLVIDGAPPVTLSFKELMNEIRLLDIHSFHLQHMMNWNPAQLSELCRAAAAKTSITRAYIHDYYFLLAPPSSQGAAPGENEILDPQERRKISSELLSNFQLIAAPSKTARDIFVQGFPEFESKVEVLPHYTIKDLGATEPAPPADKIAIIFSGACGFNKGIHNFQDLIVALSARFHWATVGIEDKFDSPGLVEHVHYNFHEAQNLREILEGLRPAVAFLGSVVPETFSFTAHEMLEAGIPILTTKASGNISALVQFTGAGRSYATYEEMKTELQEKGEEVLAEMIANAHRYQCSWNDAAFRRLYAA